MSTRLRRLLPLALITPLGLPVDLSAQEEPLRVFVFAGQSNMVGSDSKAADIERFPPFRGLEEPQPEVLFSYCIGRERKRRSDGWVALQPVDGIVGPELSFARRLRRELEVPIAIIKVAAGGTHLGGDWNPAEPSGFEMYPLALRFVRESLARLDAEGRPYRIEGFVWHQGENDMFEAEYQANYGKNLAAFLAAWRRDLQQPRLRFFIGELCTKTIWGMDLRPRMAAITRGQRAVTETDPLADFVPTSHVGVEIGSPVGLHYHYGTLGQLQHGESHARAYLRSIGRGRSTPRPPAAWPEDPEQTIRLHVLAGHRNMEGERAFVQELATVPGGEDLSAPRPEIPFRYSLGGGVHRSEGWEALRPVGLDDRFGPELSFGSARHAQGGGPIAIAKFTHSGSQIIDWTPEGSVAEARNLYPAFLDFVRESLRSLRQRGHPVQLAGIYYHVGENDMSWYPARKAAAARLRSLIDRSRQDLQLPELRWVLGQQPPTDHESVNGVDVLAEIAALAADDPHTLHLPLRDLPEQARALVLDTRAIVDLGRRLAAVSSPPRTP